MVETHRVDVTAMDASNVGTCQRVVVEKGGCKALRRVSKMLDVRAQRLAPLSLHIGWRRLNDGRDRERGVVIVVKQLNAAGSGPQQRLCLLRCHASSGVP